MKWTSQQIHYCFWEEAQKQFSNHLITLSCRKSQAWVCIRYLHICTVFLPFMVSPNSQKALLHSSSNFRSLFFFFLTLARKRKLLRKPNFLNFCFSCVLCLITIVSVLPCSLILYVSHVHILLQSIWCLKYQQILIVFNFDPEKDRFNNFYCPEAISHLYKKGYIWSKFLGDSVFSVDKKNSFHGPFYNQYYMESGNCRLTPKTTHYLSYWKQHELVTFQRKRMLWLWWSFFLQFWQWGCAVLDLPVLLHTVLITPCPHLLSFVHDWGMASYSDLAVFLTLLFGSQEDVPFLYPLDIPLAP